MSFGLFKINGGRASAAVHTAIFDEDFQFTDEINESVLIPPPVVNLSVTDTLEVYIESQ